MNENKKKRLKKINSSEKETSEEKLLRLNDKILVVKIGGSLLDEIEGILNILKKTRRKILIVPGGGIFADSVREIDPDPDAAHWMAILAMEQFGYYISSFGVFTTDNLRAYDFNADLNVLLPYKILKETDSLPHSWDVTSDSIAAWVADRLSSDLLILKSVDGITNNSKLLEEITDICADFSCEEVDSFLIKFLLEKRINTWILNARKPEILVDFLSGKNFSGTHIHGSF
ncbi:uridylate kinase [Methanomicrobium antiquum]|uniref:Uridylate kinase n=1 Tax=Methanomicrobium antiquum TaxID=487686 RepID=A0AAF0FR77_9EURY|nr:uridylate kinase [Methanomicrobium antiquum]MDD3977606.1 uridylate kinase [Methanomicrobium sp.]WFN36496.1 uridylate kinase [Methanomicrobium antiquum]